MVKNKRYKKYIVQKGFLKLPLFRKLIVLTAPNGETVPRDFYIEEKVTQVVDVKDSNVIPNAITIKTIDGDYDLIISDNFEKSKNNLKLLAEKEEVSLFWIDKEMLDIQADDDEDDIIDAIALEGVRKWIYCPYIAESYNEWVELVVRDVGNAEEYQIESEDVLCASTIEFSMRDPHVLPDVIKQQFNIDIGTLLEALNLEESESQRQILSAAIIIIQGIYDQTIEMKKVAHRMLNVLRLPSEAKVFLQYHAQTINWSTMELEALKSALPVYRIEGLIDFIQNVDATDDEIKEIENNLKQILGCIKQTLKVLPGVKLTENETVLRLDRREWVISIQASNHFDSEQFVTGESPEYIGKVIQHLSQMEMAKKMWIKNGTRIYQCVKCDFIQEHKHACESCGGLEMISKLPASIKNHRYSIQDAVRTIGRSH
ncbi:hypothetical protein [Alteromonas gracilis]|uniref:hypothetical protein n=1 Tax=Alteromonas gracilis TaxID=1479524 RepID=UPI003734DC57